MVLQPNKDRIYLSPPDVGRDEEEAVVRAVRSGWVAPLGPEVDRFEEEIASFVGASHGVALSSGTAALHLALLTVGVRPGDSVVTSTMTFVATANSIRYSGAEPVFVDCLDDGTIDPGLLRQAVDQEIKAGRRVGAIIPVDIYGRLANYSSIIPDAQLLGVPVVSDAAEALGASHSGKMAGSWGEIATLSFNGNKIITTSGGGMLLTEDLTIASRVRHLASQARDTAIQYQHSELGFNYRMSNVCAALGRSQLSRLPGLIARRKARRFQYQEFFSGVAGVSILPGDSGSDNCWLTAIVVDREETGWGPSELQSYLESLNVESRPLWKPMHMQPLYRDAPFIGGKVAETIFSSGLALPSGSAMSDVQMNFVLDAISNFLGSN